MVALQACTYLDPVRTRINAAIEMQLAALIIAWACRRWPVLSLVPARWIRAAVTPAAIRVRPVVSVAAVISGAALGLMLALLAMLI